LASEVLNELKAEIGTVLSNFGGILNALWRYDKRYIVGNFIGE